MAYDKILVPLLLEAGRIPPRAAAVNAASANGGTDAS